MPVRWAIANGDWSNTATWNSGSILGIPTGSDDVWANNFNVNINQSFSVISLNNTTRSNIATPQMTANNAPAPYVAAASSTDGTNLPFAAFNRNQADNGWISATGPVSQSGWLSMDFGVGNSTVIDGYTVYGFSAAASPTRWTFESSDNGTTWNVLQTVTQSIGNGSYFASSIGNSTAYRYYRLNIGANGGATQVAVRELELYQPGTAALAAGGSFIFNSGSISGSVTSTTAALNAGATNLIQVTATTGSVGLTIGSAITGLGTATTQIFNHSGNCDFRLSGVTFSGGAANNSLCISKSSTGTITITGSLFSGTTGFSNAHGLSATAGNTIVLGSVTALASGNGISQTAGNVTVTGNAVGGSATSAIGISLTGATSILTLTGNVTAGSSTSANGITLSGAASQFTIIGNVTGGTATSAFGISHSGTSGSVIGNVTGGSGNSALGISTVGAVTVTGTVTGGASGFGINTSNILNITGNINGGAAVGVVSSANVNVIGNVTAATERGISTASNISISVTGNVTAAATTNAVFSSSTGTVNLTGNMINVSGRQAIFAQNLFISNAATSQWRLFTQGGQDKTLYSADTFPNQPSSANVRSGSLYGPANALSGSMVVPSPSDVRVNVLTDNTVGTGQSLTAADFLAAISSSADPFAQRLRNVATVDTVGSLVTGLNGGF